MNQPQKEALQHIGVAPRAAFVVTAALRAEGNRAFDPRPLLKSVQRKRDQLKRYAVQDWRFMERRRRAGWKATQTALNRALKAQAYGVELPLFFVEHDGPLLSQMDQRRPAAVTKAAQRTVKRLELERPSASKRKADRRRKAASRTRDRRFERMGEILDAQEDAEAALAWNGSDADEVQEQEQAGSDDEAEVEASRGELVQVRHHAPLLLNKSLSDLHAHRHHHRRSTGVGFDDDFADDGYDFEAAEYKWRGDSATRRAWALADRLMDSFPVRQRHQALMGPVVVAKSSHGQQQRKKEAAKLAVRKTSPKCSCCYDEPEPQPQPQLRILPGPRRFGRTRPSTGAGQQRSRSSKQHHQKKARTHRVEEKSRRRERISRMQSAVYGSPAPDEYGGCGCAECNGLGDTACSSPYARPAVAAPSAASELPQQPVAAEEEENEEAKDDSDAQPADEDSSPFPASYELDFPALTAATADSLSVPSSPELVAQSRYSSATFAFAASAAAAASIAATDCDSDELELDEEEEECYEEEEVADKEEECYEEDEEQEEDASDHDDADLSSPFDLHLTGSFRRQESFRNRAAAKAHVNQGQAKRTAKPNTPALRQRMRERGVRAH
jgi:hypothetical protein